MDIKKMITKKQLEALFFEGSFGIEKEGLRTDQNEKLVLTDHPHILGDRSYHPYVQTDFSEAQIELVTPPTDSLKMTYRWLNALHDVIHRSMDDEEYIWPFSMPNILPDEETIPIIRVQEEGEVNYRKELAKRYGKHKQMISGVHFNFSFSEHFVDALFEQQSEYTSKRALDNELHLKLSRNFLRFQWVLTYLFGASPVADDSFFESAKQNLEKPKDYVRSIRNSGHGYHNHEGVQISYNTVETYVKDIEEAVTLQKLSEEREYYGDARLRGKEKYVRELLDSGVLYVEFRSFDVNPFDELGFSFEQAEFLHLFCMYMIWMEPTSADEDITVGNKRNKVTAMEHPYADSQFKEEGISIVKEMKKMVKTLDKNDAYDQVIENAFHCFHNPKQTLASQMVEQLENGDSFLTHGRKIGKQYKDKAHEKPFLLRGFDTLEMSTQLLIFDALEQGIKVEILDEKDQFVKLSYKGQIEYVRNGNMTSKDTSISHWIMENKTVTKKILKENDFIVPKGEEYQTEEEAINQFYLYKDNSIVVKPKSTNYGIGISIFKSPPQLDDFKEAVSIAFKEDESVLVEEFVTGTEYRFFILDGKVQAVLLRIPANVVGDGKLTVSELIEQKNSDPLRGTNHRAPLEKIQQGSIEKLMLKEQGLTLESTPKEEQRVYLRENSNISTGGDSIDFTDEVHESYKSIAEKMVEPIGVRVTGMDLIIPDHLKASTEKDPGYTVIEANFNPAMHMHAYVYEGKGRRLTQGVLDMLFPNRK